MSEWQIVVVDVSPRPMPSAQTLLKIGVPLAVARRWQKVRREMTVGLKRRVREAQN